jgi:hypothetical protein
MELTKKNKPIKYNRMKKNNIKIIHIKKYLFIPLELIF